MKNLLLFPVLLIAMIAHGQNDSIFPNLYAKYYVKYSEWSPEYYTFNEFLEVLNHDFLTGDTLGSDTMMIGSLEHGYAYLTTDGNQVYVKRSDFYDYSEFSEYVGDGWELLYDFSLNVGDTAGVVYGLNPDDLNQNNILTIEEIDTVYVQGEPRRVLTLVKPNFNPGYYDTWMQGVGSARHPLAPKIKYYLEGYRELCYASLYYQGPSFVDSSVYDSPACAPNPVTDRDGLRGVRIFPNPTSGAFTLALPGTQPTRLEVRDLSGRVLYRQVLGPGDNRISLQGCATGVYLLRVWDDNGSATVKLMVR